MDGGDRKSHSRPPALQLVVRIGRKTEAVPLADSGSVGLGRAVECAIQINDAAVSRQHLQFHTHMGSVEVEDLGSENGTVLLHGARASRCDDETQQRLIPFRRSALEVGDTLRVGPAAITLEIRTNPQDLAPDGACPAGPRVLLDRAMIAAYDTIARAARSDISVLILGETGVGKEIMAETLHQRSRRSEERFLLLNCAALPENLLESELFGHERGAFTGAHSAKIGLLEATRGGTVFLDEVGELPPATQAKLLRVLEERKVMRLGATQARPIDVRFVTATNRDLARQVKNGEFRSDLYHRISGLVVRIPPLRERPAEIEPFARHFLSRACSELAQPEPELDAGALEALKRHGWSGNVRELKNAMERAAVLAEDGVIRAEHLSLEASVEEALAEEDFDDPTLVRTMPGWHTAPADSERVERLRVMKAIEACNGNQTRAAQVLGVSRQTLINRLEKWNLPRPRKR